MSANAASDRRLGPRRFAGVKVMVTHPSHGLVKCRLRDISLEGAFIEGTGLALRKGTIVDLVLKVRSSRGNTHCRVPAKVLRLTAQGTALAFAELEEQTYQTLFQIVYAR